MNSKSIIVDALPRDGSMAGAQGGEAAALRQLLDLASEGPAWPEAPARAAPSLRNGQPAGAEKARVAALARTLEANIIPRLLLARQGTAHGTAPRRAGTAAPGADDICELAALALRGDTGGAVELVASLQDQGVPLDSIYLDLLAPVARRLGDLWLAEECDFVEVTVGLSCLQQVVLEQRQRLCPRPGRHDPARRALLAPAPGEQHGFGLLMVGEAFRRQGWDVTSGSGAPARELVAMARKEWFGVAGFSLACESRLDALAGLIRNLRRAARNPQIGILVGGRVFTENPALVATVGADATAADGPQAVLKAETLMALLARED